MSARYKFAVFGLVISLLLGLVVLALKRVVAGEFVSLIATEVERSCACTFAVDSVSFSLLRRRVSAINPRIESEGKVALRFAKIEADLSLREVFDHKLLLPDLRLYGGTAYGVSEDSPTFKFIDYLAAPIAPERDTPDRWRLKLIALSLYDSIFYEPVGSSLTIRGSGAKMRMSRDAQDDFVLNPQIETLELVRTKDAQSPTIKLGKIVATLTIKDDQINWPEIKSTLPDSQALFNAVSRTKAGNALSGEGAFSLAAHDIELPEWVKGQFLGSGSLSGSLGSPRFTGSFHSSEKNQLLFTPNDELFGTFQDVEGDFRVALGHGGPKLELNRFFSRSDTSSIFLTNPFVATDSSILGSAKIHVGEAFLNEMTFRDLDANIEISGSFEEPVFKINGNALSVDIGPAQFPAVNFELNGVGDNWTGSAEHRADDLGEIATKFSLGLSAAEELELRSLAIRAKDLKIRSIDQGIHLAPLKLSGGGDFKRNSPGSPFIGNFLGQAVAVETPALPGFKIEGKFGPKVAEINLSNSDRSLQGTFTLLGAQRSQSRLDFNLKNFNPEQLFPAMHCTQVSALGGYGAGTGKVVINSLIFGCNPHTVALKVPATLTIDNDIVQLPKLTWSGSESSYTLAGTVGLDGSLALDARGTLDLRAFLAFVPSVDDLSGQVKAALGIRGTFDAPLLTGSAELKDGGTVIEAAGIDVDRVRGKLTLSGSRMELSDLEGDLNGGKIRLSGGLDVRNLAASSVSMDISDVAFEPVQNSNVLTSGSLKLSASESNLPIISGTVTLTEGTLERQLDLVTFVKSLARLIVPSVDTTSRTKAVPDIELDVLIDAPRNLVILTNWFGAEFRGSVKVSGLLAQPQYEGVVESLSGWFGVRDRRFEVTSGKVIFSKNQIEPQLEVFGESTVWTRLGDTTLILVEVTGPITNPHISLTSDRGLSQQEILNLIASGSRGILVNQDSRSSLLPQDHEDVYGFSALLRALTTIDSLSLEPKYNVSRGVVDPAIIATKNLGQDLSLVGETFLSETAGDASAGFDYRLGPRLAIRGRAISEATERRTSFGADLTYTVLERQERILSVEITGNRSFTNREIERAINVNASSRLQIEDFPALTGAAQEFYADAGYFDAEIILSCPVFSGFCSKIKIEINEGSRSTIDAVEILGDLPQDVTVPKALNNLPDKEPATKAFATRHQRRLLEALRSEGYISARVTPTLENRGLPGSRTLVYDVRAGRPVTFTFTGNKAFSAEQFLSTINLFTRAQPFGPNTANILVNNIDRLYRNNGYLNVHVESSRDDQNPDGRIRYAINIYEGPVITSKGVTFHGLNQFTVAELKNKIDEIFPGRFATSFKPQFIVREDLDQGVAMIKEVYLREGFPEVEVRTHLSEPDRSGGVEITYNVDAGTQRQFEELPVVDWPADLNLPDLPARPFSSTKANSYMEDLKAHLNASGYHSAEVISLLDAINHQLRLQVIPGPITKIGQILVRGLDKIDQSVVLENLAFKSGDPWDLSRIEQSRKKLLQMGLFARVEFVPADDLLDTELEDLLIRIAERPLQTLDVGTGLNSEYGLRLFTEGVDRSLFGDGRSISMLADAFYDARQDGISRGVLSLRFYTPTVFSSPYSFSQDLRYQKLDLSTQEYDLDRISLASYLYNIWDSGLSLSAGHTILTDHLANVSPGAIIGPQDTGNVTLSFLSASLGYDHRDNPLNPMSGYNGSLDVKISSKGLGSDSDFFGLESKASYIQPFEAYGSRFSLANLLRAGSIWNFGDSSEVPITQRYYLGGRSTIRGFRENSLGPLGDDGSVIGGDILVSNNLELRYLYSDNLALLSFFDVGTVFLHEEPKSMSDLRESVGLGFRYLSPIGPVGIDLGHPLDARSGEAEWRVHFSLGSTF